MKKARIPPDLQPWIAARQRYKLSHAQVQMARELGLNPRKFGKLANYKQEPWKLPLPEFIEELYLKRFGKTAPDEVVSIEERVKRKAQKKAKRKAERAEREQAGEVAGEQPEGNAEPGEVEQGVPAVLSETSESQGIITHRSPWPLDQTLLHLRSAFAAKSVKVFAAIDQQAEARAVGLDMPPMHLLLVGNPQAGTPIMVAVPQVGLDLPLKVLVWEEPGGVRVSLNSSSYLATRYGLGPELVQGLRGLELLVATVLAT